MTAKFIITLIALFYVDDLNIRKRLFDHPSNVYILCSHSICFNNFSSRYITAAEVNLFFLLEVVLGPLWVWFVIKESQTLKQLWEEL